MAETNATAGRFCIIPPQVYADDDLHPAVKITFGRIFALSKASGVCTAGDRFLSDDIGITPRTVRRHVRELEDAGYLRRRNVSKNGDRGSDRLLEPRWPTTGPPDSRDDQRTLVSGGQAEQRTLVSGGPLRSNDDKREEKDNVACPPADALSRNAQNHIEYPDVFERFQDAYPERNGSYGWKSAYERFRKYVAEGVDPEDMIRAAANYASSRSGPDDFVYQASTFLGPKNEYWLEWQDRDDDDGRNFLHERTWEETDD